MSRRLIMRLGKWARIAMGRSYQHQPQREGRMFVPGQLAGYFNDLSAKRNWTGAVSAMGVPCVRTDRAPAFEFAIVIFQWGLAHWDAWLASGRTSAHDLAQFRCAVAWAIAQQNDDGGWQCWTALRRPVSTPFSAMAQGQALSLLCRALTLDDDPRAADAVIRAARFLRDPANGLIGNVAGRVCLEEYPGGPLRAVLNGWIFALVGLYDLALYDASQNTDELDAWTRDLAASLPLYDTGLWSRYDLGGNLASPFYHDLHIHQLRALARMFPAQTADFTACADRFDHYARRRSNRTRAIVTKLFQKLAQPAVGEMA